MLGLSLPIFYRAVPAALQRSLTTSQVSRVDTLYQRAVSTTPGLFAKIYDGDTRTDAARIDGVGLQTVRDWVLAFNADGPKGLIDGKAPGNPSKLNDARPQALARSQSE